MTDPNLKSKVSALFRSYLGALLLVGALAGFGLSTITEPVVAAPNQLPFSARLTTPTNTNVPDGTYDVTFRLYTVASGGTAVWTELQTVTVTRGEFAAYLGDTTPLTGINFAQTLYLGFTVESDPEMSPRYELGSVPSALNADYLDNLNSTAFFQKGQNETVTGNTTFSGTATFSGASTFTGGVAIQPAALSGNALSVNTAAGFDGNLINLQVNGSSRLSVDELGNTAVAGTFTSGGALTVTNGGANITGNSTITGDLAVSGTLTVGAFSGTAQYTNVFVPSAPASGWAIAAQGAPLNTANAGLISIGNGGFTGAAQNFSGSASGTLLAGNAASGFSGNLLDFQVAGVSQFRATATGAVTTAGALTITSGGLSVSNGGFAVTGNSTITGTLSGLTGLTVASGGASISGGINNNSGGITNAGAISGATTIGASGAIQGGSFTDGTATLTGGALSGVTTLATTGNVSFGGTINGLSVAAGVVTAGSWQGTAVGVQYGGTGQSSFTSNGIVYGNGSSALQVTAAGTSGQLLVAGGTGTPAFVTLSNDATLTNTGALTLSTVNSNVGSFGSATQVPVLTVDGKGRITAVSNSTISGVAPGGTASGDLSGSYPGPTVARINGVSLGSTTATAGNLLIGSGTDWVTRTVSGDLTISSTGTATIANDAVTTIKILDGNVTNNKLANSSLTVTAGNGLANGGSVALGASTTLNVGAGTNISVAADSVSVVDNPTFAGLVTASAALSVTGGIDNNSGGITEAGAISGATTIDASGNITAGGTINGATISGGTLSGGTFSGGAVSGGSLSGTAVNGLSVSGGTITVGTWQGSVVGVQYGGTGLSSYTAGDLLYASGTSTLARLNAGSDGTCLVLASGLPSWGSCAGTTATLQATYNNGNTITTTDARNLAVILANTATDSNFTVTVADDSTGYVAFVRANGAGDEDPAQLQLLDNLDTDRALPIALKIQSAAGGITTAVDLSDSDIVTALALGANDITGTNFSVAGASGNVTAGTYNSQTISATANFTGSLTVANGFTVSAGTVTVPAGSIDNSELANSSLTVTAGNGLINGGSVSLGGATTLNVGAGTNITVNADDIAVVSNPTFSGLVTASAGLSVTGGIDNNSGGITETGAISGATTIGATGTITTTATGQNAIAATGAPAGSATSSLVQLGGAIAGGSSNGTYLGINPASFSGNFADFQVGGTSVFSVSAGGAVTAAGTINSATISGGSLSSTAVNGLSVSGGTVSVGTWQATAITDTYVADTLTIDGSSSVQWTALTGYPSACAAGSAISTLADVPTCTAFNTDTSITLQDTYNNGNTLTSTDARDIDITLVDTATDSNFTVDIASGSTGKFAIQAAGSDRFRVTATTTEVVAGGFTIASGLTVSAGTVSLPNGQIDNVELANAAVTVIAGGGLTDGGSVALGAATTLNIGAGTNITVNADDIEVVDNPTFAGLVTASAGLSVTGGIDNNSGGITEAGAISGVTTITTSGAINGATISGGTLSGGTVSGGSLSGTAVNGLSVSGGTITVGTWQGSVVGVQYGGTGLSSYTAGDILYATGASTLAKLGVGSDGTCLVLASGLPTWGACAGTSATLQATYNNGNTITSTDARNVAITLANTATDSNFSVTVADDSTGYISFVRANGSGDEDPAQLQLLDNLDTDRALPIALKIQSAAGGITTAVDLSDSDIVTALALGANDISGSNFSVAGSSGNITAGTYNSQTISATANFTGSLTVANGFTVSAGTVTLPGGSIDNSELANSSVTVTAGSGLINGGSVSLGGATTLNIGAGTNITVNADDIAVVNNPTFSGLVTASAGLSVTGGIDNNSGGITETGAIAGATTIDANNQVTLSRTGNNALRVTGAPGASATSSLVQLSSAISGGSANGTFIGANADFTSGGDIIATKSATLNNGRSYGAAAYASVTDKAYIFGGHNGTTQGSTTITEYDPVNDSITVMTATLPVALYGATASYAENTEKIYIIGGRDSGGRQTAIYEYDPVLDSLSTMTSVLSTARNDLASAYSSANGKIYIFGGHTAGGFVNTITEFDPQLDSISNKSGTLPSGRAMFSATYDPTENKFYTYGGVNGIGNVNQIVQYDPVGDSATSVSTAIGGKFGLASAYDSDNSNHYILGGTDGGTCNTTIYKYVASTNTLTSMSATITARSDAPAVYSEVNGKVYLFGGSNATACQTGSSTIIQEYTPPGGFSGNFIDLQLFGASKFRVSATGAITAGIWQGNAVEAIYGGTGIASYTAGDMLFATNSTTLTKLAIGGSGTCLVSNGSAPTWGSCAQSSVTLQAGYGNGNTITTTNSRDIDITLADTATDSNFTIDIASGSTAKFAVQDNGTDLLRVTAAGGAVVNSGNFAVSSGTTSLGGALTVTTGGASITGGINNNNGGITNAGAISGATTIVTSGTINTATISGGTLSGGTVSGGSLSASAVNGLSVSGGTITVGTWQGSVVGVQYGGTGLSSYTAGDMIYATGASTLAKVGIGGNNTCLISNGSAPSWGSCATGSSSDTLQQTYDAGNTITTSDGRNIAITLANTATDSNVSVTVADDSTGYVAFVRADGAGDEDPAQLQLLDNLDTDRALPIALKIQSAAGGITTAIDASDADITTAIALGANDISGTNFSVAGSSGNVTAGTFNGQTISAAANFTGSLAIANGLTVSAGGATITGNSTITGTLGGLTGLTVASGSVSLPAGVIDNTELANSSLTVSAGTNLSGGGSVALGGSTTLNVVSNPTFSGLVTASSGLSVTGGIDNNSGGITETGAVAGATTIDADNQVTLSRTGANALRVTGAPASSATSSLVQLGGAIAGGSANGTFLGINPASFSGNFADFQVGGTSVFSISAGGAVTASGTINGATISGGSLSSTAVNGLSVSGGTVSVGTWQATAVTDTYVADTLTIDASSSVQWAALTGYPSACAAGSAISTLDDTPTCTAFNTDTTITLQDTYNNGNTLTSTNSRDIDITLADTATDSNFTIDIASGSTGKFAVQAAGTDVFRVTASATEIVTGGLTIANGLTVSAGTVALPNGEIGNAELTNSSVTVTAGNGLTNGGSVSLGGSTTLDIGAGTNITVNANDVAVVNNPTFSGLVTASNGLSVTNGIDNNSGGITETGAIAGATTIDADNQVTLSRTGANALRVTGDPQASATVSLVQLGNAIAGGDADGTFLGVNADNGFTGNLVDLQVNGTSVFSVTSTGAVTTAGAVTIASGNLVVTGGDIQTAGTTRISNNGTLSNVTYQGNTIAAIYGGTGQSSFSTGDLLYASSSTALSKLAAGSNGECLVLASGLPSWDSCDSTVATLQSAYDATSGNTITTTDARNLSITLANTATDSNFLVNIATGSTSKFAVQNNGTDIFSVNTTTTTIASGGLSVTGGIDNNTGGITEAGAIAGATTIDADNQVTLSRTGANALRVTGTPAGSATSSLVQLASPLSGGSASGTYLGINADSTSGGDSVATMSATLSHARTYGGITYSTVTGRTILIGGTDSGGNPSNGISTYNHNTDSVATTGQTLPEARYFAPAVYAENTQKVYYFGGITTGNTHRASIYEYDPVGNSVSTKTAVLPATRAGHSAAYNSNDGKIYIFGGLDSGASAVSSIYAYDPVNDTMATKSATLPANAAYGTTTYDPIDNKFFIFGGYTTSGGIYRDTVVEYDPVADSRSTVATLPATRARMMSAYNSNNDTHYLFGGHGGLTCETTIWTFNSTTNTVTALSSTISARGATSATYAGNGKIYLFGGGNSSNCGTAQNSIQEYTPLGAGFGGNFIDLQLVNNSKFKVSSAGDVTASSFNGVWQGSPVAAAYGGTGVGTYTAGDMLYAVNSLNLGKLAIGGSGTCLVSNGSAPTWGTCAQSSVTLQAGYANGNTITTTSARDIDITLADTATDSSFTVDIATGSTGKFAVQNNGTDLLRVTTASGTVVNSGNFAVTSGTTTLGAALTVTSGGASITGGIDNNTGGITEAGAVAGVTTLDASDQVTLSRTGANALRVTGDPQASATVSLVQIGNAIASGDADGTFIGVNADAGFAGNLVDLQVNGTSIFSVTSTGAVTTAGAVTIASGNVNVTGGDIQTAGTTRIANNGTLSNVTYQGTAVAAIYGGTGQTGYAVGDLLYASTTTALSKLTAGSDGECLVLASGLPTWDSCGGSGTTLQGAYNASSGNTITTTDARDIDITLANTATDSNFTIDIATGSTGKFAVQGNGTDILSVTSTTTTIASGGITVTGNSTITGTLGGLTGLTVVSGGASITGGINNNTGGITNTGAVAGATTIDASDQVTLSRTAANALRLTGDPQASATSSLLQIGNAIASGDADGTFLGVNSDSGFTGNLIDIQANGTSRLKVAEDGTTTVNGVGITVQNGTNGSGQLGLLTLRNNGGWASDDVAIQFQPAGLTQATIVAHAPGGNDIEFVFNTMDGGGGVEALRLIGDGSAGFGTSAPGRAVEINSAAGNNLRLTYNDNNGSATNYVDLLTTSSGDLTITPSGGDVAINGNVAATGTLNGLTVSAGTISGGVWQGTVVDEVYGGTGQSSYSAGDLLYASGASTLAKLAAGSDGECLVLASGLPSWDTCSGVAGGTLQDAYDASSGNTILTTDGRDIDITLANTATDSNFTIDIATGSTGKFAVQNNGTDVLSVTSTLVTVAGSGGLSVTNGIDNNSGGITETGAVAGATTIAASGTISTTAANTGFTANSATYSAFQATGTPSTSGTQSLLQLGAAIAQGSSAGNYIGINSGSGFAGNFLDFEVNGTQVLKVTGGSEVVLTKAAPTTGANDWAQANTDGFGSANNTAAPAQATFGDALYVGTTNTSVGTQIWRTTNGTSYTKVNTDGFGSTNNTSTYAMAVYNGALYVGTANATAGGQIWRTVDGANWTQVNTSGFGSAFNDDITTLTVFNGSLYAGVNGGATNLARVYVSHDGSTWTLTGSSGFGSANNTAVTAATVFDGYLYMTTANPTAGTQVWRSNNGSTWTQGNSSGFGDANNDYAYAMGVFNGGLYTATYNTSTGTEVWVTFNGTSYSQVNSDGFGAAANTSGDAMTVFNGSLYTSARNSSTGIELWRTVDGSNWTQVNTDGYGSANNTQVSSMVAYNGYLYAATNNTSVGTELQRINTGIFQTTTGSLAVRGAQIGNLRFENNEIIGIGDLAVASLSATSGGFSTLAVSGIPSASATSTTFALGNKGLSSGSANGTFMGLNTQAAFSGDLINLQVADTQQFKVTGAGLVYVTGGIGIGSSATNVDGLYINKAGITSSSTVFNANMTTATNGTNLYGGKTTLSSNQALGTLYGTWSDVTSTGAGTIYGSLVATSVSGGAGTQYGYSATTTGSDTGTSYAFHANLAATGLTTEYGLYIQGAATGNYLENALLIGSTTNNSGTLSVTSTSSQARFYYDGSNYMDIAVGSSGLATFDATGSGAGFTFNDKITAAVTGANALSVTGAPAASASSSLIQTGIAITGGDSDGTYYGLNTSGAFSGDLVNFQVNGTTQFKVTGGGAVAATGNITTTATGANALAVTGTPAASATSSLVQIGAAIAGGNASGTYLGLNSGSGYTGNLVDFQNNGTSTFSVNAYGNVSSASPIVRALDSEGATQLGTASITVSGSYAYVATGGILRIYDISNPSSISAALTSSIGVNQVKPAVFGKYLYVSISNGFEIYDVSDPSSPSSLGSVNISSDAGSFAIDGGLLYVGTSSTSFYIYSLTDPVSPRQLTQVTTTGTGVGGFSLQDKKAYVSSGSRYVQTFDVSNPYSVPAALASLDTGVTCVGMNTDVAGSYLYVLRSGGCGNLYIYDISDPASISLVGNTSSGISNGGKTVVVRGMYAYISSYSSGFSAVNISNPASPTVSFASGQPSLDFAIQGRYAFLSSEAGLGGSNIISMDLAGSYFASLEAGGLQVASANVSQNLTVRQSVLVGGGITVAGTASFGAGLNVNGTVTIAKNPVASSTTALLQLGTAQITGGSANGTFLGINTSGAYTGDLANLQVNGTTQFRVTGGGAVTATGSITSSVTGANALALTGAPAGSATSSLVQLNSAISGGSGNGTYIGANPAAFTGDFINLQVNNTSEFRVSNAGTVTAGEWNGTGIAAAYGGTGQTSYATGDILYASGASTLSKLTAGSDGECLVLASGVPSWDSCGGTTAVTLQNAYDETSGNTITTTNARDIDITLANTATDANFTIDIATGSTGKFAVQTNGSDVLRVTSANVDILTGAPLRVYDSGGTKYASLSHDGTNTILSSSSGEVSISGAGADQFILGSSGNAVDLIFEENSTISGQGTNTISVGTSGDIFNLNVSGVTYNVGTLTATNAVLNTSTTGSTALVINGPSGQSAALLDLQVNGSSKASIAASGAITSAATGAAALILSGTPATSATSSLIQAGSAIASGSANGTYYGLNSGSGFTGNFLMFQLNGTTRTKIDYKGALTLSTATDAVGLTISQAASATANAIQVDNSSAVAVFVVDVTGKIASGASIPGVPIVGVDPNSGATPGDLVSNASPLKPIDSDGDGPYILKVAAGSAYTADAVSSQTKISRCNLPSDTNITMTASSTEYVYITASGAASTTGITCQLGKSTSLPAFDASKPVLVIAKVTTDGSNAITSVADTRFFIGGTLVYANLPASATYQPGMIVKTDTGADNGIITTTTPADTGVAGIVVIGQANGGSVGRVILMTSGSAWVQSDTAATRAACAGTYSTAGYTDNVSAAVNTCVGQVRTAASATSPSVLVQVAPN